MVSRMMMVMITSVIFLQVPQASADATLVVEGSDGLKSMIQLRHGKGKLSAAGRDEYVIYDTRSGTITYVEPAQRQYTQMTQEELRSGLDAAGGIQEAVAPYMNDMLAGLSPAQRSMIEQRFGSLPRAPAAGGMHTGERLRTVSRGMHTISGLRCQASGIIKDERPSAEVCMATQASGKLSRQDYETLETMVSFSRSMASRAGSMLGDLARQFEFLSIDIDGVPVAVRDIEHGRRYEVTGVSDAVLSEDLFNGYAGYSKRKMPVF